MRDAQRKGGFSANTLACRLSQGNPPARGVVATKVGCRGGGGSRVISAVAITEPPAGPVSSHRPAGRCPAAQPAGGAPNGPPRRATSDWCRCLQRRSQRSRYRNDSRIATKPKKPAHDTAHLSEAFRRAVLRLFVCLDLFDEDQTVGLAWPHSAFHVHTAVWVPKDACVFTRLVRYRARNQVVPEHLTYDRSVKAVTYRSDKSDDPTAGVSFPRADTS